MINPLGIFKDIKEMKEELSLREIINEIIIFFIKFKLLILSIIVFGVLSVVVFQKIKPAVYSTTAIATSGLSTFERIPSTNAMNQRTAINLINNLQLDVVKQDYSIIALKLNIDAKKAEAIKSIKANHIYRENQDGKKFTTPKFEILLSVSDNAIIKSIQEGLLHYFYSNKYVSNSYNLFLSTNNNEILATEVEIEALQNMRQSKESIIDMSSFNLYSKNKITEVQNQIIGLVQMKSVNTTNKMMLKPLAFVQGFTVSKVPERTVLVLGLFAFLISFLIAIVVAIFVNVKQKMKIE
jgi:hypothetical protein|tara:strand:+ start:272 stop:1159 length:888 start_codon:yes stop_codon:yes gene_type:complete